MKKLLLFLSIGILGLIVTFQLIKASTEANTALQIKFEQMHNVGMIKTPSSIAIVDGDSVYVKDIELKGNWKIPESGSAPLPFQAYQWFTDPNDDSPFKLLNWNGIVFDTTWTKTIVRADSVRFQVPNRSLKAVRSATSWTITGGSAATQGWMDTAGTYYVDVYAVRTLGDTLIRTYTIEGFYGGIRDIPEIEYEVKFGVTGWANDSSLNYPQYVIAGETSMKIKFKNGTAGFGFPLINGMDSLRFVFRNPSLTFNSQTIPISFASQNALGLQLQAQVANIPGSGYFMAGDTIQLNLSLLSDSGIVLDWQTQSQNLGIQKVELVIAGPKRDYMRIMGLQNLVNNYLVQTYPNAPWSGLPSGTLFSNPIKIIIPPDSLAKFGTGTYTAYFSAKRIYGATTEKSVRVDFQVGTPTVDPLPMSSATAGQSCATCHGVNGPAKHHGAFGVEDCLPCHTDNMNQPLFKLYHVKHFKSVNYQAYTGSCTPCHLNNSHNQFTSDANYVCQSCHVKVPYLSLSHQNAIPLYSSSGLSCATANCHAGGGLGVFQTIATTHAALETRYPGGTIVAKKTPTPVIIDGVPDAIWLYADSMVTAANIKIKFLYDDNNIYALATWLDGHREYPTGQVPPTRSEFRKRWSYDGTTWTQSGDEDRLSFVWQMNDSYGAACFRTCHNEKTVHATQNNRMDVWHWKAQRTNPIGYLDDQYWDNTGRKNDAVTSGSFGVDNISGTLPLSQGPDAPSNNAPWLLQSTAVPFVNTGWVAGDKIPGYILNDSPNPITGSRADVIAKAEFNQTTGYWTLEMKRALNTGNADDFEVNLSSGNYFTLARFDNVGSDHGRQGIDMGIYHLLYSPVVIPVELISFSANVQNNIVELVWKTATEDNNQGFEIQRKQNSDWQVVGFVEGKGNSTKPIEYRFSDKISIAGEYKYRLKQVDFDGSETLSQEVSVVVYPTEFSLSQNYPNPFNPITNIDYIVSVKEQVTIQIFNPAGEVVATLVNEVKEPGYYTLSFNAVNLSSGIYFYKMTAGNFVSVKKLVLVK